LAASNATFFCQAMSYFQMGRAESSREWLLGKRCTSEMAAFSGMIV
jgi:hypothetical protein